MSKTHHRVAHLRFNKDLNSVPSAISVVKYHTGMNIMNQL